MDENKSHTTILAIPKECRPMTDTSTCTLSVVEHNRDSTVKLAIMDHEHCYSNVQIRVDMQKFQETNVKVLLKQSHRPS